MSEQKNITRVGEAVFPYLTKPDTEYNSEGVYHVKLKLKKDKASELVKRINDVFVFCTGYDIGAILYSRFVFTCRVLQLRLDLSSNAKCSQLCWECRNKEW